MITWGGLPVLFWHSHNFTLLQSFLNISIISIFIKNNQRKEGGDPCCELMLYKTVTVKLFVPFNLKLHCFNHFFLHFLANGCEILCQPVCSLHKWFGLLH